VSAVTQGQADPWQVITDVTSELLRGGQTADIRCRAALSVLASAGIDFDGNPVAIAAQEPHAVPGDALAKEILENADPDDFEADDAATAVAYVRRLEAAYDEMAKLAREPQLAPGDVELRSGLTALAAEHDRTAEAYQKSIPPTDPGSADGFRKQASADAWRSSAAGIRDALRLAAAQEPHAAPGSDAGAKLTAIRTHCERKAAEFSADMFAVRPQDIRVNAGDILAIIDGAAL
jgi:hypothetical protein